MTTEIVTEDGGSCLGCMLVLCLLGITIVFVSGCVALTIKLWQWIL